MLPQVFKPLRDFLFDLIEYPLGNTDASWIGEAFDPSSHVHAVSINPIFSVDDIARGRGIVNNT